MPATQSQSTRVKPRNSQRCARSVTRQGLVTPAMRYRAHRHAGPVEHAQHHAAIAIKSARTCPTVALQSERRELVPAPSLSSQRFKPDKLACFGYSSRRRLTTTVLRCPFAVSSSRLDYEYRSDCLQSHVPSVTRLSPCKVLP